MIDTIKIHLPTNQITQFFKTTGISFITQRKHTTTDIGEEYGSGKFKNLRVKLNHKGIYIEGSLAKFRYGTNQKTLNLKEIIKTIEEISEDLGLPLMDAKVLRLDLGDNIVTSQPVENYYKYLGETKYFNRYQLNNGLEYRSANRCISIYGKARELKIRNEILIPIFIGKNILRYEYRLLNHSTVAKNLKMENVTVNDVIINYHKFVNIWQEMFGTIYKKNDLIIFENEVFNQKLGIEKQLMILGIEQIGGLQRILDNIKEAKKNKLFKYNNKPSYLTSKFKTLVNSPKLTKKSHLIGELEQKIKVTHFTASSHWQHIAF